MTTKKREEIKNKLKQIAKKYNAIVHTNHELTIFYISNNFNLVICNNKIDLQTNYSNLKITDKFIQELKALKELIK